MSEAQLTQYPVTLEKATTEDYDARFVMSAASPDRVADTIDPKAYEPYIGQKLIALWQHAHDKPFGYFHDMEVRGGRLIGKLKAAGTNLGQMIKQLIADGVPLGASIGLRGEGEPNKQGGIHFKTLELLECSVVSVPAHPRAVMLAKQLDIEIQFKDENDPDQSVTQRVTHLQERAAAVLRSSQKTLNREGN
jgi:HK97 family phage prohead protease